MSQSDLFVSEVGPRVGFWLRAAYSGSRTKHVANLLGISEPQAKRILAGARPTSEQLVRMAREFGWRFVAFVMEPACGTPAQFAEMDAFERRLAALEEERKAEDARVALALAGVGGPGGGSGCPMGEPHAAEAHPLTDRGRA